MVTVKQVFDTAIHMMDEQSETNGATLTQDTQEYKFRTLSILNAVMPALYPYSDGCFYGSTGRPVCPALVLPEDHRNADFAQIIPLDDMLALGVLPYALAAHLLAGENEELAAWFQSRYNQVFADVRNKVPAEFETIPMPYGAF